MVNGERSSIKILLRRVPLAALFVVLACLIHVGISGILTFAFIAIAVALGWVGSAWRQDEKLWGLSQRLEAISGKGHGITITDRLAENADGLELALATMERRLTERHSLSGLPTREPLLYRMEQEGSGIIGALAIEDLDRLAGFDPDLAERVLSAIVARIVRMVSADRLVAHVDRAHFVLWYGQDVQPAQVRAEIDAIAYTLSNVVAAEDREIVPSIATRCATLSDGVAPRLLLAQTLASFAMTVDANPQADDLGPDAIAQQQRRYALEQDLRMAVARNEFELHFQPLIDAGQRRVAGAEALIRWHHPQHGMVPPSHFMPIVEASGLAEEVGLWVLNCAAREAKRWQVHGLGPLRVAVNISANQLHSAQFPLFLTRTLQSYDLSPESLEIELTEGVATTDDDQVARMFDEIRALGVTIAIDDFGTGYSSFSSLRKLAFDKIKIDREFVTDVRDRTPSQAICQSIIALGRGMDIRVLAEGIETAEEYHWLLRHGCQHFQGFYFSRPLTADNFITFVQDEAGLAATLDVLDHHHKRIESLIA